MVHLNTPTLYFNMNKTVLISSRNITVLYYILHGNHKIMLSILNCTVVDMTNVFSVFFLMFMQNFCPHLLKNGKKL